MSPWLRRVALESEFAEWEKQMLACCVGVLTGACPACLYQGPLRWHPHVQLPGLPAEARAAACRRRLRLREPFGRCVSVGRAYGNSPDMFV